MKLFEKGLQVLELAALTFCKIYILSLVMQ